MKVYNNSNILNLCRHDVTWPIKMIFKRRRRRKPWKWVKRVWWERLMPDSLPLQTLALKIMEFFSYSHHIFSFFRAKETTPTSSALKTTFLLFSPSIHLHIYFSHSFRFYIHEWVTLFFLSMFLPFYSTWSLNFTTLPKKIKLILVFKYLISTIPLVQSFRYLSILVNGW